jgi:hypothetical protein
MKKLNIALHFATACALLANIPAWASTDTAKQDVGHDKPQFMMTLKVLGADGHTPINEFSEAALDGEPAQMQVSHDVTYVASATQRLNHSWHYTPGTVSEGMSATLTPTLGDDRKIHVTYAINVAKLVSMGNVEQGGAKIERPDMNKAKASGSVDVESGKPVQIQLPGGQYRVMLEARQS